MFGDKLYSGVGYPTPESIPDETSCLLMQVPASAAWWALVVGLLLTLTDEDEWQQFDGGIDRGVAAARWQQMFDDATYLADSSNQCALDVPAPYWESDLDNENGESGVLSQSWYGVVASEVWYEQLADWTIAGFLAIAATPAAAIQYLTYVPRFRLALRTHDIGSAVKIFLDGTEIFVGDTYSASPGVMEVDVFADDLSPDTSPHNIIIMQDSASSLQVIRKRLDPNELYPTTMRYDSTSGAVQQTYDGGTTWVDNPSADPRVGTAYQRPPRGTGDVRCDAAANAVQWIHDFIDYAISILSTTALVVTLANGILDLFDLLSGGWAVLFQAILELAGGLAGIGATALTVGFTSAFYDDLLCYIYVNMNFDGVVNDTQLSAIQAQIDAHYAGTVATVMDAILGLQGAVGVTNAAAIGTVTGDCSACPTTWIHRLYLDDINQFAHFGQVYDPTCSGNSQQIGAANPALNRWDQTYVSGFGSPTVALHVAVTLPTYTTITQAEAYGSYGSGTRYGRFTINYAHNLCGSGIGIPVDHIGNTGSWTNGQFDFGFALTNNSTTPSGYISYIEFQGTGVDPFNL